MIGADAGAVNLDMRSILITAVAALAIAGCGSSTAAGGTGSAKGSTPKGSTSTTPQTSAKPLSGHVNVAIRNFAYHSAKIVVTQGTTVSFHNYDQTNHTATALNGSFDTGTIKPGQTVTIKLTQLGKAPYHCLFHAFMTGTITVVK